MYPTKCEYVYDGDTIRTKEGNIRLASIDAPELKQPLGLEARSFLQKLIEGKTVSIVPLETDKYDRSVAQVIHNGRDVSEIVALNGFAYPYFTHTINASRIEKAADYAKKLKLGVWKSYNERPQDFRKRSKPAITPWNIGAWGRYYARTRREQTIKPSFSNSVNKEKKMKVAIIGSRTFANLERVREYVQKLPEDTIVISGGARGVDAVAETTARARGLQTIVYLPDWSRGKGAGMERNTEIVADADKVVAFWDGSSNGTRDSIKKARSMRKEIEIIYEE